MMEPEIQENRQSKGVGTYTGGQNLYTTDWLKNNLDNEEAVLAFLDDPNN